MSVKEITCQECQSMMDMVLDDELAGMPINLHYPYVYQHLQTCTKCKTAFDELRDLLKQQASGQLLRVPERRPPEMQNIRWDIRFAPSPQNPWQAISCYIPQAHLSAVLTADPVPPLSRQGATQGQPYRLILADVIHNDNVTIGVQVMLQSHWTTPGQFTMIVDLSSDAPLPKPLTAGMAWGQVTHTVMADDAGRAFFTSLPGSLIEPPISDLSLTIAHLPVLD